MKKTRIIVLLALACLLSSLCSCGEEKRNAKKPVATTSRFQPGQIWSFHTTSNEFPNAKLTVVQVDFDPDEGPIIHVSLSGVPRRKAQRQMFMPFSEEALNRSVSKLLQQDNQLSGSDLAEFQQTDQLYRLGVASGELGKCFTITVAEVLDAGRKQEAEEQKIATEKNKPWPWWKLW